MICADGHQTRVIICRIHLELLQEGRLLCTCDEKILSWGDA